MAASRSASPKTYSPAARDALAQMTADYLEDLTDLADRAARRQHLDSVSAAHVRQAHDVLREMDYRRHGWTDTLLALGSFGLGTSVALWIAFLSKAIPLTAQSGLLASVLGAVGIAFIVFAAFRAK